MNIQPGPLVSLSLTRQLHPTFSIPMCQGEQNLGKAHFGFNKGAESEITEL